MNFNGTVLAIGGASCGGYSNLLFKLVCYDDDCQWEEMSQKLKVARNYFVAMAIPDEMAVCKKSSE